MYLGIMGTPLAVMYFRRSFTAFVTIDGSTMHYPNMVLVWRSLILQQLFY